MVQDRRYFNQLMAVIGVQGISPSFSLDFNSTVPAQVAVARTGALVAIQNGIYTSIGANTGRIESWNSVHKGLKLDPAVTNLCLRSTAIQTAPWNSFSGVTRVVSAATTLPDGSTGTCGQIVEANANVQQTIVQSLTLPGTGTYTLWAVWKPAGRTDIQLKCDGMTVRARTTNNGMARTVYTGTWTNVSCRTDQLANGWWLTQVTGTTSGTAGQINISPLIAASQTETYAGDGVSGMLVWQVQLVAGSSIGPKIDTLGAAVASNAETGIIADISWLNTVVGTFVIEHDLVAGITLGSGVNTIQSAPSSAMTTGQIFKTAIAYDGTNTKLCTDGGAVSTGGVLIFGADIRLLATSGGGNSGHIRVIRWYNSKLSDANLQSFTAPTIGTGGTSGALRVASHRNRLPKAGVALAGLNLTFVTRCKVIIGAADRASLTFAFQNFITSSAGQADIPNSVFIDKMSFEKETGGVAYAPVYFSGARTKTLLTGDTIVLSDTLLPSAFGLTKFTKGDVYWIRIIGHVNTAADTYPGARLGTETSCQVWAYNPATVTVSDIDGTGVLTNNAALTSQLYAFAPIVLGNFVTGDPKTFFILGDSKTEGTVTTDGNEVQVAINTSANGQQALLEMASGGAFHANFVDANSKWQTYLQYARVGFEKLGTNSPTGYRQMQDVWYAMRQAGMKICAVYLSPGTTTTDAYATEANQTRTGSLPDTGASWLFNRGKLEGKNGGYLDYIYGVVGERGVDTDKWIVNGAANYAVAPDGVHETAASLALLVPEVLTLIDTTITVTAP